MKLKKLSWGGHKYSGAPPSSQICEIFLKTSINYKVKEIISSGRDASSAHHQNWLESPPLAGKKQKQRRSPSHKKFKIRIKNKYKSWRKYSEIKVCIKIKRKSVPRNMQTNCDVKLIQLNLLWRDNWILFSPLIGTDCSFAPSTPNKIPHKKNERKINKRPHRVDLFKHVLVSYYMLYIVCSICSSNTRMCVVNGTSSSTPAPFLRLSILGNDRIYRQRVQKSVVCPLDGLAFLFI